MKTYPKLFAVLLLAGLTLTASTLAFARRAFDGGSEMPPPPERAGGHRIEHMADVLADHGLPLTEEQMTALQDIEPGPDAPKQVQDILTKEQHDVLAEMRREFRPGRVEPGREGFRPEDMEREGRLEHMGRVLDEAGLPLTPEQADQLAALVPGPGSRDKVHEILTGEQEAALHDSRPDRPREDRAQDRPRDERRMREPMGDRRQGMMMGDRRQGMMIGKILDDSGKPLTDDQKAQLDALNPEKLMREKVDAILTDEQKDALKAARETGSGGGRNRGGMGPDPEMLFEVLNDAGVPLTDDQKVAIHDLGPGKGHREGLMDILTVEQKEALKEAGKEHRRHFRGMGPSGEIQQMYRKSADGQGARRMGIETGHMGNRSAMTNTRTTIKFDTTGPAYVRLDIYDADGQLVRTLVDNQVSAGTHTAVWNSANESGIHASSSRYYYTLTNSTAGTTYKKWLS